MIRKVVALASLFLVCLSTTQAVTPAFKGAMGSGATSLGGRGGVVFNVTSLDDTTNPGCVPFNPDTTKCTLRDCFLNGTPPRYCIFRVGGVINPSDLRSFHGNVRIAGQTAPGGGIKIASTGAVMWVSGSDAVIQYISYDGNSANNGPDNGTVAFACGGGSVQRVIFDHVEMFHISNKGFFGLGNDAGLTGNCTWQNSFAFQPDAKHPVGPMSDATTSPAAGILNMDYHHNLFTTTSHRLPLFNTKSGRYVSNMIWNWDYFGGLWQGGTTPDIIATQFKKGNINSGDNDGHPHQFEFTTVQSTDDTSHSMPGPPSAYLSHNVGPQQSDPNGDQTLLAGMVPGEGLAETGPVPVSWWRSTPLPAEPIPIVESAASVFDTQTLPTVGNSRGLDCDGNWVMRRMVEASAEIQKYLTNSPSNLWVAPPGYVTAPVANGPACVESMHDGLPDQWKQARNLSLTDPNVYKTLDPNGYDTYLNEYLDGNGGTPPPPTTWTGWLGADALPGAAVGATVTVSSTAGPLRQSACTVAGGAAGAPVAGAPSMVGLKVTILPGPPAPSPVCSTGGVAFWQVTTATTPPPPVSSVSVSCNPSSIAPTQTSTCTATVLPSGANQAVTWSATGGSVTAGGIATPAAGSAAISVTATSAADSTKKGSAQISVSGPPPANMPNVNIVVSGGKTTTCTYNAAQNAYVCTIQ